MPLFWYTPIPKIKKKKLLFYLSIENKSFLEVSVNREIPPPQPNIIFLILW